MTGDAMREVREAVGIATRSAADADFAARCRSSYGAGPGDLARADRALAAITAAPASARLALARAITPDTHAVVDREWVADKATSSHGGRHSCQLCGAAGPPPYDPIVHRAGCPLHAAARGAEGGK